MKLFNHRFLFFLIILFAGGIQLTAQVTVGSGVKPEKNALLQIKDQEAIALGGTTSTTGGLLLPRVELVKRYQLLPFVDAGVIGTPDYENVQKKVHTGLMVYNLQEVKDEDLFTGVNMWDGEKWNALEERLGVAKGEVRECDSIVFAGQYLDKTPLHTGNYMTLPIYITKPGTYTVTGVPDPDNGYYFTASGVILSTGYYYLLIPGSGMPRIPTPNGNLGDKITITFNGEEIECPKNLFIEDSSVKPLYRMDCSRTVVNGVYVIDKPLNPSTNTITMVLNVDPAGAGAQYIIETNEVEGIKFSGSGTLVAGEQTVTLRGSGTPTSVDTKRMTITSNSALSSATCSAFVPVSFTKKRIMTFGSTALYGYNLGLNVTPPYAGAYAYGGRKVIDRATNFGELDNSTVKVDGFEYMNMNMTNDANLIQTRINSFKPDIIVLAYSYAPSVACVDVFIRYMEQQGVVLAFMEDGTAVNRLFSRTLNISGLSTLGVGVAGDLYTFNYVVGDEILNGPFGDVREKYWGEDASTTIGIKGVPMGMVDIYSIGSRYPIAGGALNTTNQDYITACRFKQYNMIWIGDAGFYSRGITQPEVDSRTICPLYYDANFRPIEGPFGNAAGNRQVANGIFFANAMAWAVKMAQTNGFNTPR